MLVRLFTSFYLELFCCSPCGQVRTLESNTIAFLIISQIHLKSQPKRMFHRWQARPAFCPSSRPSSCDATPNAWVSSGQSQSILNEIPRTNRRMHVCPKELHPPKRSMGPRPQLPTRFGENPDHFVGQKSSWPTEP